MLKKFDDVYVLDDFREIKDCKELDNILERLFRYSKNFISRIKN